NKETREQRSWSETLPPSHLSMALRQAERHHRATQHTSDVPHGLFLKMTEGEHCLRLRCLNDIHIHDKHFFRWEVIANGEPTWSLLPKITVCNCENLTSDGKPSLDNVQAFIAMGKQ